jgi:hypothetical protein
MKREKDLDPTTSGRYGMYVLNPIIATLLVDFQNLLDAYEKIEKEVSFNSRCRQ